MCFIGFNNMKLDTNIIILFIYEIKMCSAVIVIIAVYTTKLTNFKCI